MNIVLSTAAFCLWHIRPEEKLNICKELNFSEIEVALSTEKMTRDFLKFLETADSIPRFEKITLHAPWRGVIYGENRQTDTILKTLGAIAERMPTDRFVFHADRVSDLHPLIRSELPICLENSEWDGCWERLNGLLRQYDLPLALNINRATKRTDYLNEIISEHRHRIARIQVSGYDGHHGRMPMLLARQLDLLDKVRGIHAPLVLEGLFLPGDIASILRERQAVCQRLGQGIV